MVKVKEWLNKEKNFRSLRKLLGSIEMVKTVKTAFVSYIPQSTHSDRMILCGYKSDRYELDLWWVPQEAVSLRRHCFQYFSE